MHTIIWPILILKRHKVKRENVWEAIMMMRLTEFIKGCLKILDLLFHHLSLASTCTCTTLYIHVAEWQESPVSPALLIGLGILQVNYSWLTVACVALYTPSWIYGIWVQPSEPKLLVALLYNRKYRGGSGFCKCIGLGLKNSHHHHPPILPKKLELNPLNTTTSLRKAQSRRMSMPQLGASLPAWVYRLRLAGLKLAR